LGGTISNSLTRVTVITLSAKRPPQPTARPRSEAPRYPAAPTYGGKSLANQLLADFTPVQVNEDIPAYVVRPGAQRSLDSRAPRYTVYGSGAEAPTLKARLSEAWRQRQERAAIQHIAQLGKTSSSYEPVTVMRYQATVRLPSRVGQPVRQLMLACSVLAVLVPFGLAAKAHLSAPGTPAVAAVPASTLIAGQNLTDKLPEITQAAKAGALETGRRVANLSYVVARGDTFGTIGARFGLTGRTVRLANELPLGFRLKPGQKLVVPPMNGAYHRVRDGETLGHLAVRYEVKPASIQAANPGLKGDKLALDQKVFIPGATSVKYPAAPTAIAESRGIRGGAWSARISASRSLVGMFGARVGQLMQPAAGQFSSPFGVRGASFHPGMDICNAVGTPVHAAKGGVVLSAGWNGGYGNSVDIDHGGGVVTRYGHCSKVLVRAGQTVAAGEVIAKMGSTGFSTGPHVHFEVRIQGRAVNPVNFL
jgi:murein DD-endopeptidase MepM/ murein hydrolase activator NlpD